MSYEYHVNCFVMHVVSVLPNLFIIHLLVSRYCVTKIQCERNHKNILFYLKSQMLNEIMRIISSTFYCLNPGGILNIERLSLITHFGKLAHFRLTYPSVHGSWMWKVIYLRFHPSLWLTPPFPIGCFLDPSLSVQLCMP